MPRVCFPSPGVQGIEEGGLINHFPVYNLVMVIQKQSDLIDAIRSNQANFTQYSVRSLALFGSAARDHLRKTSDIDILVRFEHPTWKNYIGLKLFLEDLLGRDVDLVTSGSLKPAVRPSVERDLFYVIA